MLADSLGKDSTFNTKNNSQVIIEMYRENAEGGDAEISALRIYPEDTAKEEKPLFNLFGDANDSNAGTFITKGWRSSRNEEDTTYTKQSILDGKVYFEQSGDGVVCQNDGASLVLNTDIVTNQNVNIKCYLEGNNYDEQKIQILDENEQILKEINLERNDGNWFDSTISEPKGIYVPQGNEKIKVKIIGKEGARIAALTITPIGVEFPLGNYSETESKYTSGQLNTVEDCTSCMDYAYLRLKNFFNTDFDLNNKTDLYNSMVLKSGEKDVNGEILKFYEFKGVNTTVIDKQKKCFYNDENGEDRGGFFPLDELDAEKHLNSYTDKKHNYHFGMKVSGSFIYQSGKKEFFNFNGDDDVYIFINGKLAVDLGGAHTEAQGNIDMEEFVKEYNSQPGLEEKDKIKNGQKCTLDMFYLERHTTESHCKIASNLQLGDFVEYQFKSGTEGKELPEDIIGMTPVDEAEYYVGQEVVIEEENLKFKDVEVEDGVWRFIRWDKPDGLTFNVDEENNIFTGTWKFIPNTEEPTDPVDPEKPTNPTEPPKGENVDQNQGQDLVQTGDSAHVAVYAGMMLLSTMGMLLGAIKKKKELLHK